LVSKGGQSETSATGFIIARKRDRKNRAGVYRSIELGGYQRKTQGYVCGALNGRQIKKRWGQTENGKMSNTNSFL